MTARNQTAQNLITRLFPVHVSLALIVGACFISSTALTPDNAIAQDAADPFGGGGDNPFGENPVKKPSSKASDDPFGSDPFGKGKQAQRATTKARDAFRKAMAAANAKRTLPARSSNTVDAEAKIKAALDDETSQSFIETPLSDAMQQIGQTHDIPIVIDLRALEEIGLTADATVNIELRNVTLRAFLRLMLRDFDLTYLVKDEVMQITTAEAAENNLITEMYVLAPKFAAKAEPLVKILQGTVVPDAWETLGGNSTMYAFDHVLIVSTTSDVHEQVEQFLAELKEKYGD